MSKEGNKIDDPFFINKIDKYDLAFLTETHIGYDTNIPIIGNFICYIVCRPKTKANNRYFGGIAILIKKELKPHIKVLENTYSDFQLEKHFFGFDKDLFICVVYDPPPTSTYYQSLNYDIIECLEKETAQFIKKGNILLCGDFRTSNAPDFIGDDDNLYLCPVHTLLINKF